MQGTIVANKGICIVEHQGKRLYLPRKLAQGFQIGHTITFEDITHTEHGLSQINQVLSEPELPITLQTPKPNQQISYLLQKYQLQPVDLTHLETFSVDPADSLDLDDAISITSEHIYVHIPYFKLNTVEDHHAYQQQYSIYFPTEQTYHLLPLKYSTNKYSLLQDQLRLTWTLQFNKQMQFIHIYKAHIINKHQLKYSDTHKCIDQALQIYQTYAEPKENIPTYKYIMQDHKLVEIVPVEHTEVHQMIEYFMIKTNCAVANYLHQKNILFPRRVHDSGKEIHVSEALPTQIAQYFKIIKSPAAYYTTQAKSHAQLNVTNYTHFTSPIRRYIDQVVSRLLDGETLTSAELSDICTQANAQERKIDAMNEEYLQMRIKEYLKTHSVQTGTIIYVSAWGIHVLLIHLRTTAQLHVSKLALNKERLKYQNQQLIGIRSFKLGDEIQIQAELNLDQLSWNLI